ncbi:MAG: protease complex subunit PrcB family protein [Candidatus Melainabacteria bacterium]|nr:protease complex subunit PrcB family protein [Candidatus Melainabacteria bacterium]
MKKFSFMLFGMCMLVAFVGNITLMSEAFGNKDRHAEHKKPAGNDVHFTTIDSGVSSGIATRESLVIRDEGDWLALWRRHASNRFPAPSAPNVNFSSEMIIAVFSGGRGSGGYAIKVERITDSGTELVVTVGETGPERGNINTMALTQPFHMVQLAKASVPVVFQGM